MIPALLFLGNPALYEELRPIGRDRGTVDEPAFVGGKECHAARNFLWLT